MNTLVIDENSKSLSVECYLEVKMRRDVKLLYDVMADTIGYFQLKMRAASLQLARTHTRFTHCARRDYKLTSRGAREEQDETFSMRVLELSHFESVPKQGIELHEVCVSLMSAQIKVVTGTGCQISSE